MGRRGALLLLCPGVEMPGWEHACEPGCLGYPALPVSSGWLRQQRSWSRQPREVILELGIACIQLGTG